MPLTPDEFESAVNGTCKHCASGNEPRWRPETSEYCHDFVVDRGTSKVQSHSFCLATGLRKFYQKQNNE